MPNLYILDVKKGNCAVLFDTLGITIIDAGQGTYLFDFLISKGVTVIDTILISHADADHIRGLFKLLTSSIKIKKVFMNPDMGKSSKTFHRLAYALNDNDDSDSDESILEPTLTSNLNGKLDKGNVHIEIVAPQPAFTLTGKNSKNKKGTSNSISAVVRLSFNNKPIVLFTGDIDEIGLENIYAKNKDIRSCLLVFPHHGGNAGGDMTQYTQLLCSQVQAEHVIFSVGDNTDKFPLKAVIDTISLHYPNTTMYTTNDSIIFEQHIRNYLDLQHQNNVGHIHINFENMPMELEFISTN